MVISRITSGLGNQLFQYACGRALSLCQGVPMKLDLQNFQDFKNRRYALNALALKATEATPEEVNEFLKNDTPWQRLVMPRARRRVRRETGFGFDETLLRAGPDVYLIGYWQSPRYFEDVESEIRRELVWRIPPPPPTQAVLEKISAPKTVSIHVRRGDYVSNPGYAKRFGALPLTYYERALQYLAERETDLHGVIFSDEPAWVKATFPQLIPFTVVEGNEATEDLRLMTACRRHVIANSTFSWWGAWLAPFPDKTVLAPARFFNDSTLPDRDLVPEAWVRI
ncbi:MAG: alpha-1,2-fucosyltransferase [Sphingobacteriaceae bacterium]|nr:alpha-1,2-fucosyltransferase [Cytophagaceae bacterium]